MIDIIISLVILLIIVSAIGYINKEKKKGVKCVGCADAKTCCKDNCHE